MSLNIRSFVRLAAVAAVLGVVPFAQAQLAQNGTTTSAVTFTNAALTATVAHTTPAFANRVMAVAVHMNTTNSTGTTVASITYAGTALVIGQAVNDGGAPNTRTEVWYLVAPATGTNNVVVTVQNVTAGQSVQAAVGITTYVDVDQQLTGSLGYTNAGNSTTPSNTLAGTANGDMVIDFTTARMNAGGTLTATVGAGQTSLYNTTSPGPLNANDVRAVASRETSTGANVTMSYTLSASSRWSQVGGSLRAATTDVRIAGYATPDLIDGSPTTVSFIFTVTAQSTGANNINFSDTLPAGLTIVSATPSQGTCTPAATTTCALGNLINAGDSATVTLVATTTSGGVATTYNNTATITSGTTDAIAGNNSATVTVRTQSHICSNPGKDGAGGTITGNVNTYFPATANAAAGATTITLGAVPAGYGTTAIAVGDLLLVMQMQDAAIDSNNDDRYGDGAGTSDTGTPGNGSSNLNNSGRYEYVVATNAVTVAGGALNFTAAGVGNGLIYAYTNANSSGTQGARRYQVIRVPQYTTATLAAGTGGPAWQGTVGGVFAIDVSGTVTMGSGAGTGTLATTNGSRQVTGTGTSFTTQVRAGDTITITGQGTYTVWLVTSNTNLYLTSGATATAAAATYTLPQVSMSGRGFRGAAARQLAGGAGANTDYRTTAATATNAQKGEGFAGTPRYLFAGTGTPTDTAIDGYPNGSSARGAPGNAGGGGTDGNPAANDQNTGGGGGGNAGAGGGGGNAWNSAAASGGFGGSFEAPSTTRLVLGGGGGAGTTNNGTSDAGPAGENSPSLGTNGINSSGVAGGGIVIIRANQITGTGRIQVNGSSALKVANDAGGGGGAGGTVVIDTTYGTLTSMTIEAKGGRGGDAWLQQTAGAFPGNRHGPGGGGGGGAIYVSSAAGSTDVTGGASGMTCNTPADNFGASDGENGIVTQPLAMMAGADSGHSCAIADLAVTNVDNPDPVTAGSNITYTQTLTNNGPNTADQPVFTTVIPASSNFQSMTVPPGWTCITPAVGGTGLISCTSTSLASGASANFSVVVQANLGTPAGYVISNTANATSLTNDSNYANNTATTTTNVVKTGSADVAVTATAPSTVVANTNYNVTQTLRNNGGDAAANPTFTENTPPNTTFQGITPPAGWTCITPAIGGTGAISCSSATPLASGASVSFPLTLHVNTGTASGTAITVTDNGGSTTPDPYTPNNTASATTTVVAAGSADWAATVTALNDPSAPSGFVSFSEVVRNNGVTATNASFTQNVPANTTFYSLAVPAGWTCVTPAVGGTGAITCNTTAVGAVGSSFTFVPRYVVNTGTAAGTVITDTATVNPTGGPVDSIPANNTASDTSTVLAPSSADLAITKTDSPDPVGNGQFLTWLITVANNGPAVATGVTVSDTLPGNVVFQSDHPSQGFCSGTSTITCNLGTIPVNGTATISVIVSANTGGAGTITNTATVSGTLPDPVAANNSSTATTTVLAVTLVKLRTFNATQKNKTVQLTWQTEYEQDNLGFNIWRDLNGQHTKINKTLIGGTALLSKKHDEQSGYHYSYKDKLDDGAFAQYWLEDIDLHGTSTMHGPISPVPGVVTETPNSNPLPGTGADASTIVSQDGYGVPHTLSIGTPSSAQFKQQYDLAGDTGLKIYVTKEGWYRVTRAAMIAAGYDPGNDGKKISVYVAGIEQQVNVDDGGDNKFDANDAIEFYGIGLDTASTGARTYWLRAGKGTGDRIKLSKDKGGDPLTTSVPYTYELLDRSIFFAAIPNTPDDQQNFFGPIIFWDPATQQLPVANLDTSYGGNASVEVAVQGASDGSHLIAFAMNGQNIGTASVFGQQAQKFTFNFPQSFLANGTNTLSMQALNVPFDVSVLSSTHLTYQHLLRADNGALEVTLPGGRAATVGGFAAGRVRAIDVTDPQHPIELETTMAPSTGGEFTATFTPSSTGSRIVLVMHESRILTATEMSANKASSINATKGADLVIVSHANFLNAASTLKPVREAQGITTLVTDVEDVYDEFNFGIRDPQAIKTMLQTAQQQWKTVPRWVLLAGDASFDPRNYLGVGATVDFVPTKMVTTALMKTASDAWITDMNGDGLEDIAIGRIPVRTADEANTVFNKITSRGTPSGTWTTNALFITDVSTDFDFAAAAQSVAAYLPPSWTSSSIDLTTNGTSAVVAGMNNGSAIVDYIGHGSIEIWGTHDVFNSPMAAALTNANRQPFVVAMTCLTGYFNDLFTESMAEALLKNPNGGAVAVFGSSTLTEPDQQAVMNRELFSQLFNYPGITIGEACMRSKNIVLDQDVKKSWMLFGDPSMKLK